MPYGQTVGNAERLRARSASRPGIVSARRQNARSGKGSRKTSGGLGSDREEPAAVRVHDPRVSRCGRPHVLWASLIAQYRRAAVFVDKILCRRWA